LAKIFTCILIFCTLYSLCPSLCTCKNILAPGDSTRHETNVVSISLRVKLVDSQGEDPNILEVPFRLSGNLILVEAEVNDKKGFFIFDSGAPDLIINSRYLPKPPRSSLRSTRTAAGVTGKIAEVRLQRIEKFTWQEYELHKTTVKSIDLSHIEQVRNEEILGLIGFELFKAFEIQFDLRNSRLLLFKLNRSGETLAQLPTNRKPDHQVSFMMGGHVPILKLEFGSHKLDFGLDTGAEMNILDIRAKRKVLQYFRIKKRGKLHGNGKGQLEVLMGEMTGMKLNGVQFPDTRAILADLSHMNKAYNLNLEGVLGYHFLIHYKTSINFVKRKIYLWQLTLISKQD